MAMTHVAIVMVDGPGNRPMTEELTDCNCALGFDHIVHDEWD